MVQLLSEEELNSLLALKKPQKINNRIVEYSKLGPGKLDKWKRLVENQENCWQQITSVPSTQQKKTIIFSNDLLKNHAPSDEELAFFAALIEHYNVVLWPGPNKRLVDVRPMSSTAEFWRSNCQGASKQEIEMALTQQGLSSENYAIIDPDEYDRIHRELRPQILDVDTKLPTPTPSHIVDDLRKGLKTNVIENLKELVLVNNHNITELDLQKGIKFKQCSQSKRLILDGFDSDNIDFSIFPDVEELVIRNCWNLKKIDLSAFKNLKKLVIIDDAYTGKDLPRTEIILAQPSLSLTEIHVSSDKRPTNFTESLKSCPNLKSLTLAFKAFKGLPILEKLEKLEVSILSEADQIEECTNLRFLHAECCTGRINLPANLESFVVRKDHAGDINFENAISLKRATINAGSSQLKHINACKQLNYLLYIDKNPGNNITIPTLPNLMEAYLYPTNKDIIIESQEALQKLMISGRNLNQITLREMPELNELSVSGEGYQELKLNGLERCPNLTDTGYTNDYTRKEEKQKQPIETSDLTSELASELARELTSSIPKSISQEQLKLHRENSNSPITQFSMQDLNGRSKANAKTGQTSEVFTAKGGFAVTLYAKNNISHLKHHLQVLNEIQYSESNLEFVSSKIDKNELDETAHHINKFTDSKIEELKQDIDKNPNVVLGRLKGNMQPGIYYPLVTNQTLNKHSISDIYARDRNGNPIQPISLFWSEKHHQFFVKHDSPNTIYPIEIAYVYKQNPVKTFAERLPQSTPLVNQEEPLLPDTVKENLEKLIASEPKLAFLRNKDSILQSKESINDTLNQLQQYCRRFTDVDLTAKNLKPGLDTMLACIKEQHGTCEHRSQTFMLLARYIGIPVNMVVNPEHAFCSVPFMSDGKEEWYNLDLGGSFRLNLTPTNQTKSIFDNNKINEIDETLMSIMRIVATPFVAPFALFASAVNALTITSGTNSTSPTPNKNVRDNKISTPTANKNERDNKLSTPPIVSTSSSSSLRSPSTLFGKTAQRVHTQAAIQQQNNKQYYERYKNQFLEVIQDSELKSIKRLLTDKFEFAPLIRLEQNQDPFVVHMQIRQQLKNDNQNIVYIDNANDFLLYLKPYSLDKGSRKQVDGPLVPILEKGGIIIVNWSNFSDKEMISYKSILDAHPTLLGQNLTNEVKVIGIEKSKGDACSSFLTRCQPFTLHADFYNQALPPHSTSEKEPIEVDLFHLPIWRELLLGDIKFAGHTIELKLGPLMEAIKSGASIKDS